jgi:hypothetical protein
MRKLLAILALAVPALVVTPGAAAGDTPCMGTLTGPHDNVVVPAGGACFINSAQIKGSVTALQGSTLHISSNTTVHGNVLGDGASNVQIFGLGNVFHGDIQITRATFAADVCGARLTHGNIQVEKSRVFDILIGGARCAEGFGAGNVLEKGNIKIEENFIMLGIRGLEVLDNVHGNLQVFKNTGPGLKTVQGNQVRESIQCFENESPFIGGPNIAREAQGQCSATPLP